MVYQCVPAKDKGTWLPTIRCFRTIYILFVGIELSSELCIFFVGIELCIFLYGFAKKQNGYKRSSKLQHCLSELFSAPDNLN